MYQWDSGPNPDLIQLKSCLNTVLPVSLLSLFQAKKAVNTRLRGDWGQQQVLRKAIKPRRQKETKGKGKKQ